MVSEEWEPLEVPDVTVDLFATGRARATGAFKGSGWMADTVSRVVTVVVFLLLHAVKRATLLQMSRNVFM
jgi:hypothetical protein